MKTKGHRNRAFTLAEMLVIVAVVFLLILVLLGVQKRYGKSREQMCVEHLKKIGLSFRISMGDGVSFPMSTPTNYAGTLEYTRTRGVFRHFLAVSNELAQPINVYCPGDGTRRPARTFGPGFADTNISYFVGLDADEAKPNTLLAGDRNLTNSAAANPRWILELRTNSVSGWSKALHWPAGNVALADGSVQWFDSQQLRQHLTRTGNSTNRIQLPD